MEKSRTNFWATVERIFSDRIPVDDSMVQVSSGPANGASGLCTYARFLKRMEQCTTMAEQGDRLVLLLLMEFIDTDETWLNRASIFLARCLRAGDAVCLLSGGRLAVLVEGLRSSGEAAKIAKKLQDMLRHSSTRQRGKVGIRACVGAGLFPLDAGDSGNLWYQAHLALERARDAGFGTCCFSEVVTGRAAMERLDLIKDAYHAFKNGEFFIVYQPIFAMDSERVTGVEALLRWQHPQRGLLYPQTFMELLEESGLIVPIGEWVLTEACRVAGSLPAKSSGPIRVCVNVSARQLSDPGFLLAVLDGLYDAGIDAGRLQLEFSEQTLAQDSMAVEKSLLELGHAGVRVAIDHFGVGKSSLTELLRLPVTLIKIDRSLVDGLAGNAVSQAITSGALAMANGAGMSVAAVGIEDNIQMQLLGQMGCAEVQGRLLALPHSSGDLLGWLPA